MDKEMARALLTEWDDLGTVEQDRHGADYADMFAALVEEALASEEAQRA